jgi:hypothetical protein
MGRGGTAAATQCVLWDGVWAYACSGAGSHRSLVGLTRRRPLGPCYFLLAEPHAATEGVRAF